MTYDTSRNPCEDFSEDEVDSRYPNIPQDTQGYKEMKMQGGIECPSPT
jgi:hypothetical protein